MTDIKISVNFQTINCTNCINEEPTRHTSICAICQFQFDGVIIFIERGRTGGGPARSCVRNSGLLVVLLTRTCETTPPQNFHGKYLWPRGPIVFQPNPLLSLSCLKIYSKRGMLRWIMQSLTHPEVVSLDEDLRHDNVRITFRRHRSLRYGRHPVDELELQCERWHAQVRVLVNKMPSLQHATSYGGNLGSNRVG